MSTILIVEDETAIADTLAYVLRTEGHETVHVTTGAAALERLTLGGIALAIVDVGLPDINGFDLLLKLRQHPRLGSIPVIMLTGHVTPASVLHGMANGADGYVSKPFQFDALGTAMETVLGIQ